MMVSRHKYVVSYHPRFRRRVSVRVFRDGGMRKLTLFALQPFPEIEDQIPDGGPFLVNEWKQVLKPIGDEEGYRQVLFLGEFPHLRFLFRLEDQEIDNSSSDGLRPGDRWPHHEAGIRYRFDLRDGVILREVQRREEFALEETTERLPDPPAHLMDGLKRARQGQLAGRFFVNEHGLAFTPEAEREEGADVRMLYAGRIDVERDRWFPKYEGEPESRDGADA